MAWFGGYMAKRICIITDSTADLPPEIAIKYGITVVPIYVRFGEHVYQDGVDLPSGQFYQKLRDTGLTPSTSQPSPEDFFKIFSEAAGRCDGIIAIHLSSKISGTFNSALLAKSRLPPHFPVEIIDSRLNSAGLALAVLYAAKISGEGKNVDVIVNDISKTIPEIKMFGMFSTVKYLARSGRVNKAIAIAGSILSVKPLLTFHDGDVVRAGFVRTVPKGINRLLKFIESRQPVSEMMIVPGEIPVSRPGQNNRRSVGCRPGSARRPWGSFSRRALIPLLIPLQDIFPLLSVKDRPDESIQYGSMESKINTASGGHPVRNRRLFGMQAQ
jgi:DegV family protein with EDD domain